MRENKEVDRLNTGCLEMGNNVISLPVTSVDQDGGLWSLNEGGVGLTDVDVMNDEFAISRWWAACLVIIMLVIVRNRSVIWR